MRGLALKLIVAIMKRLALFCILHFACCICKAQDLPVVNRIHISGGPKLGLNLSKLDGANWDGGYKTNLLGGAWLSVHGERFGAQIEGLFSQTTYVTGNSFDSVYHQYIAAGKDSIKNGRFMLSYFNIPVMGQVRILSRVWLQLGVQYSGVVSVKDKDAFVKDAESLFSSGSFAGVGGLWIDVSRHLNMGARYVVGLSNMNEQYDKIAESWKQRNIQIHIGYSF